MICIMNSSTDAVMGALQKQGDCESMLQGPGPGQEVQEDCPKEVAWQLRLKNRSCPGVPDHVCLSPHIHSTSYLRRLTVMDSIHLAPLLSGIQFSLASGRHHQEMKCKEEMGVEW